MSETVLPDNPGECPERALKHLSFLHWTYLPPDEKRVVPTVTGSMGRLYLYVMEDAPMKSPKEEWNSGASCHANMH